MQESVAGFSGVQLVLMMWAGFALLSFVLGAACRVFVRGQLAAALLSAFCLTFLVHLIGFVVDGLRGSWVPPTVTIPVVFVFGFLLSLAGAFALEGLRRVLARLKAQAAARGG